MRTDSERHEICISPRLVWEITQSFESGGLHEVNISKALSMLENFASDFHEESYRSDSIIVSIFMNKVMGIFDSLPVSL